MSGSGARSWRQFEGISVPDIKKKALC